MSQLQQGAPPTEFTNWCRTAISRPAAVVAPNSVDELIAIIRDRAAYPSPLRPAGHFHSMNDSISTPGTQVLMNNFTDIRVDMQKQTITVGAFVTLLDIARALRPYGMQIECSPEIGNATAGSVACCGTKDASIGPRGLGQVSSCVTAMKLVNANGEIEEASVAKDPERMRVLRASYGLLGSLFEVTFNIQKLVLLRQSYASFKLDPVPEISALFGDADGVLGLILPYSNLFMVERRRIVPDDTRPGLLSKTVLKLRNTLWEHGVSYFSTRINANWYFGLLDRGLKLTFAAFNALGGSVNYRNDSTIDFKFDRKHYFDFTFWGVPVSQWKAIVPQYIQFCKDYEARTGYRMNLPAEVYFIRRDTNSILSFSEREDVFTMDLVDSRPNDPHWTDFNRQFNYFVSDFGARPLLNQTKELDRTVVQRCFGAAWDRFSTIRTDEDANGRFLSPYFADLVSEAAEECRRQPEPMKQMNMAA